MRRVDVSELKNRLSEFLRLVKRGETVEVRERSVPIARIQGLSTRPRAGDGRLKRLLREGVVAPAESGPYLALLKHPPVRAERDPVQALIEERGDR